MTPMDLFLTAFFRLNRSWTIRAEAVVVKRMMEAHFKAAMMVLQN
ncbi:hypothetical protein [Planktotalea sp.]